MSFEVRQGPRGPLAFWEGRQLTSAYDAGREALAWVKSLAVAAGSLVFVAGDPLGLAAQALSAQGVRAIALVPGGEALAWVPDGIEAWAPGGQDLEDFLQDVFETTGPEAVSWQVWPAFERQAPGLAGDWGRRFRDLFRTVQGSWLTRNRFGPRFWTNAIRNFVEWENPVKMLPGNRPLVIAASGPSLDDGLGFLARHRDRFDLWALPSSFETLVRRGLRPDAGVATDGGFYAREHLHRLAGTGVPILAALGSAADPQLGSRPTWFFSQGLTLERALLGSLGPVPEVPSQGTVAVTALRLALEATTGPVFIAGLDLSFRDLRGHTSPHTVDRRLESQHSRLKPLEELWAARLFDQAPLVSQGFRTSPALVTYAGWFRSRAHFSRTVYRIAPSAVHWNTMTELSWAQAVEIFTAGSGPEPVRWPRVQPFPDRPERIARTLQTLETLVDHAQKVASDAPWLIEAAGTAVPGALADDFRARREGKTSCRAQEEFCAHLNLLQDRLR